MLNTESGTSILFRSTSLVLIGIPILSFVLFFIFLGDKSSDTTSIVGVLVILSMPFVFGVMFGLLGLCLKSVLSPVFTLMKVHWLNHVPPTPSNPTTYSSAFHDDLKKHYFAFDAEQMYDRGRKLISTCFKISIGSQVIAWLLLLFSFALSEADLLYSMLQFLIGLITWLNPISFFTGQFVLTEGAAFVMNFTLLPTAYYAALSLENISRLIELRLWSGFTDTKTPKNLKSHS